jgi:hypothetical protein
MSNNVEYVALLADAQAETKLHPSGRVVNLPIELYRALVTNYKKLLSESDEFRALVKDVNTPAAALVRSEKGLSVSSDEARRVLSIREYGQGAKQVFAILTDGFLSSNSVETVDQKNGYVLPINCWLPLQGHFTQFGPIRVLAPPAETVEGAENRHVQSKPM